MGSFHPHFFPFADPPWGTERSREAETERDRQRQSERRGERERVGAKEWRERKRRNEERY